jgi:hypothetical protein
VRQEIDRMFLDASERNAARLEAEVVVTGRNNAMKEFPS